MLSEYLLYTVSELFSDWIRLQFQLSACLKVVSFSLSSILFSVTIIVYYRLLQIEWKFPFLLRFMNIYRIQVYFYLLLLNADFFSFFYVYGFIFVLEFCQDGDKKIFVRIFLNSITRYGSVIIYKQF